MTPPAENPATLHQMGLAACARGEFSQGVFLLRAAVAGAPNLSDFHLDLGRALQAAGDVPSAVESLRKAVSLAPGNARAHCNLGLALKAYGDLSAAAAALSNAINLQPSYPVALANLGLVLADQQKHHEAVAVFERALQLEPGMLPVYAPLGNSLLALDRAGDAVAVFGHLVAVEPANALNHFGLGNALAKAKRYEDAIAAYRRALSINPQLVDVYLNLSNCYSLTRRNEEAIAAVGRLIQAQPDRADAYCNLGNFLSAMDRFDDAVIAYRRATSLDPAFVEAHCNLAMTLVLQGKFNDAMAEFDEAIRIRPDFPEGHFRRGQLDLLLGNFARGWEGWEGRRGMTELRGPVRNFQQPLWDGGDVAGKTFLINCELGYGDTVQFIRYASLLADRGARVIVETQPEMVKLVRSVRGISEVIAQGQPLPAFDVFCPLLSLPRNFKTTVQSIPCDVPYLTPDTATVDRWKQILGPSNGRRRIGLAWGGNPDHPNDARRSIATNLLAPLATSDVEFHHVRNAPFSRDEMPFAVVDHRSQLRDFSDTAALISQLDLVISVDTVGAHLAGAMGKPVWMLLPHIPDWRWMLDRADTPWYPTMRLFRQKKTGDWPSVLGEAAGALESLNEKSE